MEAYDWAYGVWTLCERFHLILEPKQTQFAKFRLQTATEARLTFYRFCNFLKFNLERRVPSWVLGFWLLVHPTVGYPLVGPTTPKGGPCGHHEHSCLEGLFKGNLVKSSVSFQLVVNFFPLGHYEIVSSDPRLKFWFWLLVLRILVF